MAIGATTISAIQNILKTKYDQKKLHSGTYPDCAFLGRMRKDTNFGGNNSRVTMRYGRPQGGSHDITRAFANISSSQDAGFLLTRAKDYHVCEITAEALLAGEGSENTVLNAVKAEMEGCLMNFKRSISLQLYGNGGGARGQISSGSNVATDTVTLAEPADIVFFEPEMVVQASAADGTSGSLLNSGARETIEAVDRDLGTLRATSAAWNTVITSIATGSYLFRDGDFGLAAKGLRAWLPSTAPGGSDLFFGVNRSVDATRLAGVRFTASAGASKEDTLIDCSVRLGREGGVPDAVYTNNLDRADIIKNLMGKATFEMTKATDGVVGYKALILAGDKGDLKVIADPNCPRGKFFMLQEDTWVIKSIKGLPHLVEEDGNRMTRKSASDNFEWRYRALWQLGCEWPGFNAVGDYNNAA
jgi:hypothetical protein